MAKTKQDEIKKLQLTVAGLLKDADDFRVRNARLVEDKNRLEEESAHYKKRFEEMILEKVELALLVRSARAAAEHHGKELLEVTRKMFERGARRAQYDENYAVFRELLIGGKALNHENFVALVKANPTADIKGLVQVAEEFELDVRIDLVEKDLIKQGGPILKKYNLETKTIQGIDGKTYKVEMKVDDASMWAFTVPPKED